MHTGVTDKDLTVQVMQKSGARMEKLNQGRNGHLVKDLIILSSIAAYVESQVIISKMYCFWTFSPLRHLFETNWWF